MPVSDKDHGGVAVTPAVAPGGGHKPLDLGLRQVLAGAQVAIGAPAGRNCSFYDSWRDHPEMSFRHVFGPPSLTYWSYNDHFSNSAGELSTRFYRSAPLSTPCPPGRPRRQNGIAGHWHVSARLCRRYFRRPCSRAPSIDHSYRQHRGLRSIRTGAHIHFALTYYPVHWRPAATHRRAGRGSLVAIANTVYRSHFERHRRHIESVLTNAALDSAASADSLFIALDGMLICGMPAPIKTRPGTAPV